MAIRLIRPTSNNGCYDLLEQSLRTGLKDFNEGREYLTQEILQALTGFNPIYLAAIYLVNEKKGLRIEESAQKRESFAVLEVYCRDFLNVAKRKIYRLKLPLAFLAFYQMTQEGDIPKPSNDKEWLNLGAALIQGDVEVVAAGEDAMINPSAAELQVKLTKAQSEFDDMAMVDRAYDIVQADLAVHRITADSWIDKIIHRLDYVLYDFDDPSRRRIKRTYGFKYESDDGGAVDVPGKCLNFTAVYDVPNLTLACDPVDTATGYLIEFSTDQENWSLLSEGVDNSHTYQPPLNNRYYRIRASNEYGDGEWSDVISFDPPDV
ncbi:MAG: fibronectin type III domain-containing protein [Candidatus Cloacimonetes bacterium]|nr:fibronectin type III domain-containing protein [Candidatus Cloacimonadota bacterium]